MNDMSIEECSELLGKSKGSIQKYLKSGKLEPVYYPNNGKRGRVRRISLASVARYVKEKS